MKKRPQGRPKSGRNEVLFAYVTKENKQYLTQKIKFTGKSLSEEVNNILTKARLA